jgi:hypothetical protein
MKLYMCIELQALIAEAVQDDRKPAPFSKCIFHNCPISVVYHNELPSLK